MILDGLHINDIVLLEGSYKEVVNFPPMKTVKFNNWYEMDGIEADLSAPKLDTKDVKLQVGGIGDNYNIGLLYERLSDSAYHTFNILDRNFNLRLKSSGAIKEYGFSTFDITLVDDFPIKNLEYLQPNIVNGYPFFGTLDDIDFRKYGVAILEGTLETIRKSPDVKENLLVKNGTINGAIYDDRNVRYKSKDITLKCLMRADDVETFWQQHDNLLIDLVRPEERILYVDDLGMAYPCFYKSCTSAEFYAQGGVWWTFSIIMTVTKQRLLDQ